MKVSAVIFDLDGTVLDNEDEYGIAFRKVLASLGKRVEKKYPHTTGIGVKENWPRLLSKYHIKTKKSMEELTRATQDAYLDLLDRVTFKNGFEQFVKDLKSSGIITALATSNAWWIVDEVSDKFSISDFFSTVTTGEEVEYKKPDPDLFLSTAQKLSMNPEDCLVIEDSEAGIEAAHRAGMKVIGIAHSSKHAKSLKETDRVVSDYRELTPQRLLEI